MTPSDGMRPKLFQFVKSQATVQSEDDFDAVLLRSKLIIDLSTAAQHYRGRPTDVNDPPQHYRMYCCRDLPRLANGQEATCLSLNRYTSTTDFPRGPTGGPLGNLALIGRAVSVALCPICPAGQNGNYAAESFW